ncbi:MAG: hypothetical protein M3O46_00950 [Myxococcota bacterium]|nr:hypothetical protein [Myxococcota bacterium]
MSPRVVLLLRWVIAAIASSMMACAHTTADTVDAGFVVRTDPDSEDAGPSSGAAADAPPFATASASTLGSPLCNAAVWMGCYPDDPTVAKACSLAPDGGVYSASAGYDNVALACHVERVKNGSDVKPVCTAAGGATDGMACRDSVDCAPGYECVGDRTCRHYCCAGSCSRQDEFCDIQPTASDLTLTVPVCMTIRSCGLLDQPTDAGSCPRNQTCAVVDENGATSCVVAGQGKPGDSCDTDHCARWLTCVGTSGHRRCYELCHTMAKPSECSAKETCTGGLPLFPVPGIGICQ